MYNQKLIDRINKLFDSRKFSIISDILQDNIEPIEFKMKIIGTKKMFWIGTEREFLLIDIYILFKKNGEKMTDKVFTIFYDSNPEKNWKDGPIFFKLHRQIRNYLADVMSWFSIEDLFVEINEVSLKQI